MSNFRAVTYSSLLCAGLLAAAMMPQARADAWNQKTTFTFSGPVEVPGRVLPAGTYVFILADSQSDRNIVQVFNQDQNRLYGTYLTIPDYRLQPASKPVITFQERAAGAPPAVKSWFWPGENYGHEFVYGKTQPAQLASATSTAPPPAPSVAQNTPPAEPSTQPEVTPSQPAPSEAQPPEVAEAAPPPPASSQPKAEANRELPQTASQWPLMCLIGLLTAGTGSLLGLTGRQRPSGNR
ncbi:MAG TPA: hypothetical protein VKV17_00735 [Bryobacteraceae bacterium]|nr:hypothetical protein [Bryobacteraceae bacterium]